MLASGTLMCSLSQASHRFNVEYKNLVGCDTFVAFPPATPGGTIVFGKNSDRPEGERQSIKRYGRKVHFKEGQEATLCQCTYIKIPQVRTTKAVLLSQIDWMFGAEMGANECGVVIGNEAVWTKEPCRGKPDSLLGMDLVRLGLERGNSARDALDVITSLLAEHGQGGACAENDPSFTYHNSFLIVDRTEAWVLETADRHWVAERVKKGVRNISNCLSIRANFDLASPGLKEYAIKKGYWKQTTGEGGQDFDFTQAFCTGSVDEEISDPRFCGGKQLLEKHAGKGTMNKDAMIAILRDHSSGICMHGGFATTSSWVSEINMQPTTTSNLGGTGIRQESYLARHWVTGPHPCQSSFEEKEVML